jgi:hypothetical protein
MLVVFLAFKVLHKDVVSCTIPFNFVGISIIVDYTIFKLGPKDIFYSIFCG